MTSLLVTNGGCRLPCWWGIQPGESRRQQVADLFSQQPFHDVEDEFASFSAGVPSLHDPSGYHLKVEVIISDATVSNIDVFAEINSDTAPRYLSKDWQGFAWNRILTDYGVPDQVYVNLSGFPSEAGASALYALSLLYEKQGFEIGYVGSMVYDTKTKVYRACPVFDEVTQIHLTLTVPGRSDMLRELLKSRYGGDYFAGSFKSVTGMDTQTFYQQFMNKSAKVCFNSNH